MKRHGPAQAIIHSHRQSLIEAHLFVAGHVVTFGMGLAACHRSCHSSTPKVPNIGCATPQGSSRSTGLAVRKWDLGLECGPDAAVGAPCGGPPWRESD